MAIRNENDQLLANLTAAIQSLNVDITSSVGDVTVNTSELEALLSGSAGEKTKSGAGLYPVGRAVGGTDAEGAAPTVFPVLTGGRYDSGGRTLATGSAGAIALSASGHVLTDSAVTGTVTANLSATDNAVLDTIDAVLDTIKVDTQAIETATEAILAKNAEIEVSANALVAANHTDLLAIEASADALIAANHTDLVALEATLTEIATDGDNIQTLLSTLDGVQDSALIKLGEIETTNNANEALLTTIDADTNDIKTSVQLLDNAVDGNYLNTNVNIAGTDVDSNSGDKSAATQRVVIATDDIPTALINTNLAAIEASADALIAANHSDLVTLAGRISNVEAGVDELIAANHTDLVAIDAVLDTIDADTGAIKTAVEIIDNAINGNEMQVDVVASLPAGSNAIGKLAANSGVDIGDVDVTTCGTITPGHGAAHLGKREDDAHANQDVGVMSLAVRNDALAPLGAADGDYAPLQVDATGALYTNNQFGTFGSILVTGTTATTCGVADRVFVAIYMLTNTVFNASSGLVAETTQLYLDDTGASTDIDADAGAAIDGITFPAGMTLYGRYTGFTLASGSVVAYVG